MNKTLTGTDAIRVGQGGNSPLKRMLNHPDHYQSLLANIIRTEQPRVMIETGVESGYSSEHFLAAMDAVGTGHLYSCDPAPSPFFDTYPIRHPRFTFIREPSYTALDKIFKETGRVDVFLHDSDHSFKCQTWEYEWAWEHVRPGGIISSDDVGWSDTTPDKPHHAWKLFCERHGVSALVWKLDNAEYFKKP
jgi:predicted O-methyltransferase YrrM